MLVLSMAALPHAKTRRPRRGVASHASKSSKERDTMHYCDNLSLTRHYDRLKEVTKEHPHDITVALHGLVEKELLVSEGSGRRTRSDGRLPPAP